MKSFAIIKTISLTVLLNEYSSSKGYKVLLATISKFASSPLRSSKHPGNWTLKVLLLYLTSKISTTSLIILVSASTPSAGLHPKKSAKFWQTGSTDLTPPRFGPSLRFLTGTISFSSSSSVSNFAYSRVRF